MQKAAIVKTTSARKMNKIQWLYGYYISEPVQSQGQCKIYKDGAEPEMIQGQGKCKAKAKSMYLALHPDLNGSVALDNLLIC